MGAALALVATILPLLPTIEADISGLIQFISGVRSAAKQSGEWTNAQESAFVDALIASAKTRAWTPDAQLKSK